jgi:diaminohydroxyphosphoribosylaminopyrimidine deaminase/5-amino-6-(5-phosphoribosylamino)uracil reductase
VPALVEAAVGRVVVGCVDPNPKVSGKGVAQLRQSGITVDVGVLEADARQLIAPFIAGVVHGRPYVTLKWAQSADGKVAGAGGRRVQISNERSMRVVHELRARCDAILVGINTVLADDPTLTVRGARPMRPLRRVVLDSHLRIPADSKLVRTGGGDLRVYTLRESIRRRGPELQGHGVYLVGVDDEAGHISLPAVLRDLYQDYGLTHALVDAGPTLARAFLDRNLADRVWVFRSPKVIDEEGAPQAVPVEEYGLLVTGSVELDGDVLTEYLNPRSDAFAAAERSADQLSVATP